MGVLCLLPERLWLVVNHITERFHLPVVGLEGQQIADMQCGFNHTVVLTSEGSVWAFGARAAAGGTRTDVQVATQLKGLGQVSSISVG